MSIRDSLLHDHHRTRALFERVLQWVESGRVADARALMDDFALLLNRHVYAENEVLVPAYDLQPGTEEAEFINVMLQEHDKILAQTLRVQHLMMGEPLDLPELQAELDLLAATMAVHVEREERGIYRTWDTASGEADDAHTPLRVQDVFEGKEDDEILGDPLTG